MKGPFPTNWAIIAGNEYLRKWKVGCWGARDPLLFCRDVGVDFADLYYLK